MSHLIFPAELELTTSVWNGKGLDPYNGHPLAFGIVTFARQRNDYHLGPFFTDEHGVLRLTSRQLELSARAQWSCGLMDYMSIHDAYSFVEIVHWSAEQVSAAIHARTSTWRGLLDGEAELYGTVEELIERLQRAANHRFSPPFPNYGRLRDEWSDATRVARYTYSVSRA